MVVEIGTRIGRVTMGQTYSSVRAGTDVVSLLAEFGRRILLWDSLRVALYLRMPIVARPLSSYHLQLRGEVAH